MNRNISVAYALALAAACLSSSAFAADLPKSGTYAAHYGWTFSGQVQELGANRTVYAGVVAGVIFNEAGKGFLHKARVDCTLMNDVNQGRANANGTCVVTDAEGDKAFLEWKCTGTMPACPGDERWGGGTGKYTGMSGTSKFQGNFIGATGAGWSDWSGEYKLP
jgi:hypothetical protein